MRMNGACMQQVLHKNRFSSHLHVVAISTHRKMQSISKINLVYSSRFYCNLSDFYVKIFFWDFFLFKSKFLKFLKINHVEWVAFYIICVRSGATAAVKQWKPINITSNNVWEDFIYVHIFALLPPTTLARIHIQEYARKVKNYDGGDAVK